VSPVPPFALGWWGACLYSAMWTGVPWRTERNADPALSAAFVASAANGEVYP